MIFFSYLCCNILFRNYNMNTYSEVCYLVLDELKLTSDDSLYNEEHVLYLLSKYRAFLLKQKYANDIKKAIPESNYQTISFSLEQTPAIAGEPCEGGTYLRTATKAPYLMTFSNTRVYPTPTGYFNNEITYVTRDRFKYVGCNKYLQNIIYATLGPDNYLYLKSSNPQYLYLEGITMTGIFEDASAASELDPNKTCDLMDRNYPLEEALIPIVVELVVKELKTALYGPEDTKNNGSDDLAEVNVKQQ